MQLIVVILEEEKRQDTEEVIETERTKPGK